MCACVCVSVCVFVCVCMYMYMCLSYGHFCEHDKLNGPTDLQM